MDFFFLSMLLLKMIGKAKYKLLYFMDKEDLKTFLLEMSFSCFSVGNVIFLFVLLLALRSLKYRSTTLWFCASILTVGIKQVLKV